MTDRLGEALARTQGRMLDVDEELIMAAARAWHALTNAPDARSLATAILNALSEAARVDALTVTAEEDK